MESTVNFDDVFFAELIGIAGWKRKEKKESLKVVKH